MGKHARQEPVHPDFTGAQADSQTNRGSHRNISGTRFESVSYTHLVENYTRESGVRELEKKINKVMRKIALEFARDGYEVMHEIKPARCV